MPAVLALPDLGLLLAGLLLSVLAFALFGLRDLIVSAFSHVPLVGGWISGTLGGWLGAAARDVVSASRTSLRGADRLFNGIAGWMGHVLTGISHTFDEFAITVVHIAEHQIPRAFDLARHEAAVLFDGLRHDAARWVADARHAAAVEFDGLRHDTLVWVNDVRLYADRKVAALSATVVTWIAHVYAYTDQQVAAARTDADTRVAELAHTVSVDVSGLAARADSLFATAEHDITAGVASAEAAASIALARGLDGLVTDLDTWGKDAYEQSVGGIDDAVRELERAWGETMPWIKDLAGPLAGAGAAGLLGALIRSAAVESLTVNALDRCVFPNCENLSQLGKELADLLGASSTALLIAWLIFAVTDPKGWARDMYDHALPVVTAAFRDARVLLEVPGQGG